MLISNRKSSATNTFAVLPTNKKKRKYIPYCKCSISAKQGTGSLKQRQMCIRDRSWTCVHRAKVFTRMKQYLNPRVCPCHTPLNTRHACCTRVAWPIPRVLLVCSHLSQSSQTPAGIDSEVCSVKLRKWALLPELLFLARSARWRACERTSLSGLPRLGGSMKGLILLGSHTIEITQKLYVMK